MADTSSYNQLTNQPSMMDRAQGFMGLMQGAMQNRVAIGQREAGKAVQGAIGEDGTVDQNKLMQGISSNPLIAPVAAEAVQAGNTMQQGKVAVDQAKFNLIQDQMKFTRETLGSLAVDPDLTPAKVIEATGKLIAQGIISPQQAAVEISSMPQDPDKLRGFITQHLTNSMAASEKFQAAYGSIYMTQGKGENGEDIVTPIAVPSAPGMPARVAGAPAAPEASPLGAASPNAAPGQQTSQGAFVTSLPAGQQKNLEESATAVQNLRKDLEAVPQRMFTLNKALTSLKNAPTGKGSDWQNTVKSYVQTLVGEGVIPGVDAEQIKSFDEANKYLIQYAQQQASTVGSGTDAALSTALSGNANTHISNLAAQDVVKANMALERMRLAQGLLFDSSKQPDNKYSAYAVQWGKNIDPVAFGVDLMEPKLRKKYFEGLTPEGKKRFRDSVKIGLQTGVIDRSAIGGQ